MGTTWKLSFTAITDVLAALTARLSDNWTLRARVRDAHLRDMETENPNLFDEWIAGWSDLVEFEIVPVITSTDAAGRIAGQGPPEMTR